MDLKQRKLNKAEWESIEVPVSQQEIEVLKLIIDGYNNVNVKNNNNNSIFTFLKIEYTTKMEDYLYTKYFQAQVDKIEQVVKTLYNDYKPIQVDSNVQIKSADKIRLERNDDAVLKKQDIYENVLLQHADKMVRSKKDQNDKLFTFHYFTMYKLRRNSVKGINRHVSGLIDGLLEKFGDCVDMSVVIENAVEFIEKNSSLLKR